MSASLQNIPSKMYFIKKAWFLKPQIYSDQKNTTLSCHWKKTWLISNIISWLWCIVMIIVMSLCRFSHARKDFRRQKCKSGVRLCSHKISSVERTAIETTNNTLGLFICINMHIATYFLLSSASTKMTVECLYVYFCTYSS